MGFFCFSLSLWSVWAHVSVITSTGSVLPLDLCLRLRRRWEREEGAGRAAAAAELTERESRSEKG